MNKEPSEYPLNKCEFCWNFLQNLQNKLLRENKKYNNSKNYTSAICLDTLQEACDKLQYFIDENTD